MSEQELNNYEDTLSAGLKESYEKMLQLKMKLGQKVVLGSENGEPIIISAEKAWERYQKKSSTSDSLNK